MTTYRAHWNGTVLAESSDTVEVEGNQYFPVEDVKEDLLTPSEKRTTCPWKGEASYYTLSVGEQENPDAAWYYPEPKAGAEMVKDRVAFWKGVVVEPLKDPS